MKRRSKTKFTQIHVSIPVRLLEDLDESLSFSSSRSKLISQLIQNYLESTTEGLSTYPSKQLMAAILARNDVDELLKALILQLLSNKGE